MNWLAPALIILSIPVSIAISVARALHRIVHDEVRPMGRDDADLHDLRLNGAEAHAWATAHGFSFDGYYRARSGGLMLVWERSSRAEMFLMYRVAGAYHYDLATIYDSNCSVTTASTRGLFPIRPGACVQHFPERTFDQRWELHCQADAFVRSAGHVALASNVPEFADSFVRWNRRSALWVRMQPLWYIRVTYWFFVRRFLRCNVDVAEQHRRGWVRLPHEFTVRDRRGIERLTAKCGRYEAATRATAAIGPGSER